jgi:enoyl-CoA hydratase/carnithine racemase
MDLTYEKREHIVIMTISRPEVLNALAPETLQEFSEACISFRDDDEAWVAIVTGAGEKAFCVGSDLKKAMPKIVEGSYTPPPSIRRGLTVYKPFIAAINGIAAGGGLELALACDIRIAAEGATFSAGEARWSLMPGMGGTQRLPRIIGPAKAMELMFMATPIDANEAYRIGLVNKVVPRDELMSNATEWAETICQNGPLAIRAIKKSILSGLDTTVEQGLELEEQIMRSLFVSEDSKEGLRAFMEKRKPAYKGR